MPRHTLYVLSTSRGPDFVRSWIDSLHTSGLLSWGTALVLGEQGQLGAPGSRDDYLLLPPDPTLDRCPVGFRWNRCLQWAIDQDVDFDQALCLPDTAVILGPGLDEWLSSQLAPGPVLVGAAEAWRPPEADPEALGLLAEWGLPYASWAVAPHIVHAGPLGLARTFLQELFDRLALVPPGVERWPLTYGCFMSWAAQILDRPYTCWGSVEQPTPPLYLFPVEAPRLAPAPANLDRAYRLFYPTTHVLGYAEADVQEQARLRRQGFYLPGSDDPSLPGG